MASNISDEPNPDLLGIRPLNAADVTLLHHWRNTPHVVRWYKPALSLEEAYAKYVPRTRGEEPTRAYLILYAGQPIGYIQVYRIRDYPEYQKYVQVEEDAAGVDLFIGEPDFVHRGLGAPILRCFLREVVFADPAIHLCIIGPEPENRAAIRAYQKAGFRHFKTVQLPDEDAPAYLMRIEREAVLGLEDDQG